MKKAFKSAHESLRQYWRRIMDHGKKHMSFGANCLNKIICRAHGDQWRRGQDKKHHKA